MIKAKPPRVRSYSAQCKHCGEVFSYKRWLRRHIANNAECHERWWDEMQRLQGA